MIKYGYRPNPLIESIYLSIISKLIKRKGSLVVSIFGLARHYYVTLQFVHVICPNDLPLIETVSKDLLFSNFISEGKM